MSKKKTDDISEKEREELNKMLGKMTELMRPFLEKKRVEEESEEK